MCRICIIIWCNKGEYIKDEKLLHNILQCVANKFDKSIAEVIVHKFELNDEKINASQEYGQFDSSKILGVCK